MATTGRGYGLAGNPRRTAAAAYLRAMSLFLLTRNTTALIVLSMPATNTVRPLNISKTERVQYINDVYDIIDSMLAHNERDESEGTPEALIRCAGRLQNISHLETELRTTLNAMPA